MFLDALKAVAGAFGVHASANGWAYSFWSGFGSDLTEFGMIVALWRHMNCQSQGCWRVGRFPVGDGRYKVCHVHHPEVSGRSVPQDEINAHHEATRG